MRLGTASLVAVVLIAGCTGDAVPPPVELAERHVTCLNDGDLEGFLDAFADDTVIVGIGTADHPDVAEAAAFMMVNIRGTDGYVASCESWGDDGALCEGPVYDRVTSPAGLSRHLTLTYRFDSDGDIVHFGEMDVYDAAALNRYSAELAAWIEANHPELAPAVTEFGHIKKTGAEVIELLIPLAEEFIAESDNWPLPNASSG